MACASLPTASGISWPFAATPYVVAAASAKVSPSKPNRERQNPKPRPSKVVSWWLSTMPFLRFPSSVLIIFVSFFLGNLNKRFL